MKITNRLFIIIFLFSILLIEPNSYANTSSGVFLEVPTSARASGMGESFTALADDPFGVYYNPAGISFIKYPTVSFLYQQYIQDVSGNSVGITIPGKIFSFNLAPSIISMKEEPIYDSFGNDTGRKFKYQGTIVPFSAAVKLEDVSLGATAKYYKEDIDTDSRNVITYDAGAIYRLENLSLGMSMLNMAGKLGDYDLPTTFRYGVALMFKNMKLLYDYSSQLTINQGYSDVGGEFVVSDLLFLRLGYKIQDQFGGMSYGLGIRTGKFDIDYAASSYSDLGIAQTLGISYSFGTEKAKETAPLQPVKELARGINIAVSEFIAKNTSAADASIVTDFIRTELVSSRKFNILERANMEMILAEQKFQISGCTSQECAVKMGKILNVRVVLIGSLSKLLETYYITVSLVNVETGEIMQSIDQKAMTADELKQACKAIVEKIK